MFLICRATSHLFKLSCDLSRYLTLWLGAPHPSHHAAIFGGLGFLVVEMKEF